MSEDDEVAEGAKNEAVKVSIAEVVTWPMLERTMASEQVKYHTRPIVVYLSGPDLATFVVRNVLAAAMVKRFVGSYVMGVFKAQAPFRSFIADCNPYINGAMTVPAESEMTFPVDWFDEGMSAPVRCPDATWYDKRLNQPKLVLTPTMLGMAPGRFECLAEAPPRLRLPGEMTAPLLAALAEQGLDEARWFACIDGAVDPGVVQAIEGQGGQVVRVGEDGSNHPPAKGVTDLTGDPSALPLRVGAIARARYVVCGEPATAALASAFGVPCAGVDVGRAEDWLWNAGDIFVPGAMTDAKTLAAVADALQQRSAECTAWRAPGTDEAVEPTNTLRFPFATLAEPIATVWGA